MILLLSTAIRVNFTHDFFRFILLIDNNELLSDLHNDGSLFRPTDAITLQILVPPTFAATM